MRTASIEDSVTMAGASKPEKEIWPRIRIALLCVSLSAIAVVPFYFIGGPAPGGSRWDLRMPVTHDMWEHYKRMQSFYHGLSSGEIYPRWAEDANRGFGAPIMSYFPAGVYYLTSAVYFVARDWMITLLITHLLIMTASGAAIYLYARSIMSRAAASVAMAAYIILPYHLIDHYQRGALNELTSFIFLPLIFLFIEKLFKAPEDAKSNEAPEFAPANTESKLLRPSRDFTSMMLTVAALAATYGAYLWSHPPTAYLLTLCFAPVLPLLAIRRKDWRGLIKAGCALALGLALSAAYLYPAKVEQSFIHHELSAETFPYRASFVFINGYSYNRDFFRCIDACYVLNTVTIILAALVLLWRAPAAQGRGLKLRESVVLWTVVGCFMSFMMTHWSDPVGRLIPMLYSGLVQFSWRMLAITTLMAALMVGACVQMARDARRQDRKLRARLMTGLAWSAITVGVALSVVAVIAPVNRWPAFQPYPDHLNEIAMPRKLALLPQDLPVMNPASFTKVDGTIDIKEWKPEYRHLQTNLSEPDKLNIRTFNFPGWTATIDGQPARIITGRKLSNITLRVPAGMHDVVLSYVDTPARRAGNAVTLGAFLVLIAIALLGLTLRAAKRREVKRAAFE